jgi:putative membrane protein
MHRWTELVTALTLAAAVAACGGADNRGTEGSGNAAGTAGRERAATADAREFITTTAANGLAEVELGRLAQQNAGSADVKQFGQMMERDHSQANDELQQIAERQNAQLPVSMSDTHRDLHDRLSRLSGREFDREYIKAMVDAHQKTVERFERQANDGDNPEVKQFVSKTLPTVRQHLERAQQIQQMLE